MTSGGNGGSDVDIVTLRETLHSFPVAVGVLFGSSVRGRTHPFSDVDIGVVFESSVDDPSAARLNSRIAAAIVEAIETDDVDVVDLSRTRPSMAYEALATGQLLVGEERDRTELEARYLQRKLDFDPIKREWHAHFKERMEAGSYGRP